MATISIQKFQSYWRSVYKGELEIPFSERLLSILFYQTDVGQIPRGKAQSISPASSHCNDINWKKAIPGCYWCSNGNTGHQGICCSPNCLLYFHEWCVRKVKETTESAVCLLPGCEEENVDKHHSVCSEIHKREYLERYSIVDGAISSPKWYIDRAVQMPQNKSDVTMMDESNSLNSSSSNSSCSDVTMKGTDSSLFIFSKRLYEGLIYKTDVGPIPRDSYCEEHLTSSFTVYVNWRAAIEGCYWCGKATHPNQYTYVCDKRCYQYFHEWCRRKLSEFCREYLCMYPGCDESVSRDVKFCSEFHQNELEKKYKTTHNCVSKCVLKTPDWYNEDSPKLQSDIPQTDECYQQQQQQQQQQQVLPFILSEQLTTHLMQYTDIGPVPREILVNANVLSQTQHYFLVQTNWNTIIQGCYWCLGDCSNNFATIFCCKECFFLFNEWSFKKLEGTPAARCCKYLNCPTPVTTSQCCSKHSRKYSSEFGKLGHLLFTTRFILGPMWYHNGGLAEVDFYNRDEPFYEFANFYASPIKIDDVTFPTSEHYFQSQKFVGTPYLTHVSAMSHPREAFDFSRSSSGRKWIRPDWSAVKNNVMYKVLKEKFTQNPELANLLISTCNAHLYEHTSVDSYWGDGGDARTGQNKLGLLLMKVRSELQAGSVYVYHPGTLSHHTYEELYNLVSSTSPAQYTPPVLAEVNSQSIQPSEVNFNLDNIRKTQEFPQQRNSESDWVSDEHQSVLPQNSCTHGTFGRASTNDPPDSPRPPPYNPDYQRQPDNSESMDVSQKSQKNPFRNSSM